MTDTETTDTETTEQKPITAGAAAPAKKSGKKAAAKAKAAPKAKAPAAPKTAKAAAGRLNDEGMISIISKDHGFRDGSKRDVFFKIVKEGQTVAKYKTAFAGNKETEGHSATGFLHFLVESKLIKIGK
jgi:hypothetical protein